MRKYIPVLLGAASVFGCAQNPNHPIAPPIPLNPAHLVIKARELLAVSTDAPDTKGSLFSASSVEETSLAGSLPVTVGNGVSTSMKMDTTQFVIPVVCNQTVDFGFIGLSTLSDNNLNVCGPKGNEHCGTALIRMYTTGTPGPGFWNSVDQYGAPITVGDSGQILGLGDANAVVLQTISIPKNKHTVKLSDFSPIPRYAVASDFTDAGAGSYSTTLVIEYALAP